MEKQVIIVETVLIIHTEVILNESADIPKSQLKGKPNNVVQRVVALDNCDKNTLVAMIEFNAESPKTANLN